MASGVVRAAISEVLEQEKIKAMLGTIKTIITEESGIDVFDLFAESLLALLNGCCSQGKAGRQHVSSKFVPENWYLCGENLDRIFILRSIQ